MPSIVSVSRELMDKQGVQLDIVNAGLRPPSLRPPSSQPAEMFECRQSTILRSAADAGPQCLKRREETNLLLPHRS
jgi:hypothetical protein